MSKKRPFFRSLYARFIVTFLGLWWGLNLAILAVMYSIVTQERMERLYPVIKEVGGTFYNFKLYSLLACGISILLGTIVILLVVRSVVKPIRAISGAAREVASGRFDISLPESDRNELGQLAADFNTMTRALQSTDTLRSRFVSSVSHEFRTPITSIKGYVELLRDDAAQRISLEDATKVRYCDIIVDESNRLIALSSDLMRLSALESGAIEANATYSLDEQLRKTILLLEPLWSKKDISFELALEEATYTGGKDLLEQVWINLFANAIKFSHKGGQIDVRLVSCEDDVKVVIADQGIGISEEARERLFEPFFVGDKGYREKGNGLGLAIVKRAVDLLHGQIDVSSTLGTGTSVVIQLPTEQE